MVRGLVLQLSTLWTVYMGIFKVDILTQPKSLDGWKEK